MSNDLDLYFIKALGALHSKEHLLKTGPSLLQLNLEESIRNKSGINKDLTALIAASCKGAAEEICISTHIEEGKATTSSSDNELELDLFNEDLMCVVCNGMDVAARNRLLECSDCHSLYHQECHRPPVSNDDADGVWTCHTCKEAVKLLQKSTNAPPQVTSVIAPVVGATNLVNKTAAKNSSSSLPPPQVQKSAVSAGKVHFNTAKQNSKPPAPNSKSSVSAHMITVDKRLQIMKKKAAKLHEKRKQLPR